MSFMWVDLIPSAEGMNRAKVFPPLSIREFTCLDCLQIWTIISVFSSLSIPPSSPHWYTKYTYREWDIALSMYLLVFLFLWKIPTTINSVAQSCPTLCDPMNLSTPGPPVHQQLLELTQTHVHRVADAIQPSHPLSSPSPPALIPSQHQGLFQWVNSSCEVAKVLVFQLQHQSFQWTPRTGLL